MGEGRLENVDEADWIESASTVLWDYARYVLHMRIDAASATEFPSPMQKLDTRLPGCQLD